MWDLLRPLIVLHVLQAHVINEGWQSQVVQVFLVLLDITAQLVLQHPWLAQKVINAQVPQSHQFNVT
jgi:hypothetical protein